MLPNPSSSAYGERARFYLELAVLNALAEAKQDGSELVKGSDIARITGLKFSKEWVVRGILYAMRKDGRVYQSRPSGPWFITKKGMDWLGNNPMVVPITKAAQQI